MDNQLSRLLIYQSSTHQLIEVSEDADGVLNPNTLTVFDASYFNLQDPQGMTIDPILGNLYFLDTSGPKLVSIESLPDEDFENASINYVDLPWAENINLHGIAFDSTSGNFHVANPIEQKLYEFSVTGELVAERDLAGFYLTSPQGLVFAPSGDQTDDPSELSLYLAA